MKLIQFLLILLIAFISLQIQNQNQKEIEKGFSWNETQILIASDGENGDLFGYSLDIKGNICVIGAYSAKVGNNTYQGKAYVYEKNGTNWDQKQILIGSDGQSWDAFGLSVVISNDENYLAIGAPYSFVNNESTRGKVYIFQNNGTFWNEYQILIANDGKVDDEFGKSISISNDSSFFLIGAPQATIENVSEQGKAYIFQNNGTFWNLYQILIASDGSSGDYFADTVSISSDSSFLFIGVSDANVGENEHQGKVYIFQNNGTFWNEYQILIASDGTKYDEFGGSISTTGDNLVICAYNATIGNNPRQGKVYVYQNNGTNWNQKQILIGSDGKTFDEFGSSVSISKDANFLLIGAPQVRSEDDSNKGKAYIFQNNGTFWNLYQILIASDGKANDLFGYSVSISGNTSLISSPDASVINSSYQGKAYIFEPITIPQVDILNCSSLFSSFKCYWNKINSSLNEIEYQINYQSEIQNWEVIQSPILNENVLYQIFNSSIYQDIKGNVDYSIQIKACNYQTENCGNPSNQINLTTKIDSVKNLNFESYLNSIQLNWNYPNVPIINSIPKLNHYFLSYQIQDSNQSTNVSISNSSTSFQINNLESATNYLISIYGCITEECLGNDKGEITTIQVQTKQTTTTTSSSKSKTTTIALSIVIPIVVIVGIILTIIFIKKKKNKKEQNSISYSALKDEN